MNFAKALLYFAFCLSVLSCAPVATDLGAENSGKKPFNQLDLASNACGPAALLNSWRFGNPRWETLSKNPPNLSDRERIRSIARGPAMRESSSLPGRARWTRNGINLLDLRDVANEISQLERLPPISQETFFLRPAESQASLLKRVHTHLGRSLNNGFTPLLSIRQYELKGKAWEGNRGHFVTVTGISEIQDNGFHVKYIDPLGGKFCSGEIQISSRSFLSSQPERNPNLEAIFPQTRIGSSSGRSAYIAVSASLGQF